jgi:hypothetical protein
MTIIDFNNARRQDESRKAEISADTIRDRLNADAGGFVSWLFSGRALVSRGTARVGDVMGTPGASLSIHLTGPDTGLWKDHATDEGGDLIALYRANMGYAGTSDFVLSLKEIARDYLGDTIEIERPSWRPTPAEKIEAAKVKLGTKPRADHEALGAPVATYKYFDTHGTLLASVVRHEPDGTRASKTFRPWCYRNNKWVPGAPDLRPLYHLPIIATSPTVVLVEGEGCADALHSIGIVATSAMQGANAPIEKTDWSPLSGKAVTIWPDNDEPGTTYARNVAAKLVSIGCKVRVVPPPVGRPPKWDAGDCVAEGGDVGAILLTAVEIATQPKPRIRILDLDDLENLAPPSFLIDDVLTEGGLSVIWGRSGAMKSFVALDMAMCIASGLKWHGKPVRQGLVVYLAAEGSHGLGRRAIGWRRTRGRDLPKPKFKLIPHNIAMTSDDLNAMIEAVLALDMRPVLIVIDTLARTFGSGDENKQADMNAYVSAADRLREATGANVLIVHHSGVHEDKRERGSNVLRGAADTVIKISRKDDKIDIINHGPEGKQKDAEEFKTIKLETKKVYFEQGAKEQSTLVLNLREGEEPSAPDGEEKVDHLGSNQQAIVDHLKAAGTPLGFMRLLALTKMNNGSLQRTLDRLVELEIISVDFDASGNTKQWSLCS